MEAFQFQFRFGGLGGTTYSFSRADSLSDSTDFGSASPGGFRVLQPRGLAPGGTWGALELRFDLLRLSSGVVAVDAQGVGCIHRGRLGVFLGGGDSVTRCSHLAFPSFHQALELSERLLMFFVLGLNLFELTKCGAQRSKPSEHTTSEGIKLIQLCLSRMKRMILVMATQLLLASHTTV